MCSNILSIHLLLESFVLKTIDGLMYRYKIMIGKRNAAL